MLVRWLAPTIAVLPSAERATDSPKWSPPFLSGAWSFSCRLQVPVVASRVNTEAEPWLGVPKPRLSRSAPTIAVAPSGERATDLPKRS